MSLNLENDGLVGKHNDRLAMVVDNYCRFTFEVKSYPLYTDYVLAKQTRTADIFANSGMLAARSAMAEGRTAPGPRRVKVPHDDRALPPLLPQRKSSHIARKVSEDYDKDINLDGFVRSNSLFSILRGLHVKRPFICPTQKCQFSGDELSSLSIISSQLTMYLLLPNVSSPSENPENQINRHG